MSLPAPSPAERRRRVHVRGLLLGLAMAFAGLTACDVDLHLGDGLPPTTTSDGGPQRPACGEGARACDPDGGPPDPLPDPDGGHLPPPRSDVLAAGAAHTCAVGGTGGLSCWGDNSSGQLGDGSGQDQPTPVPVPGLTDVLGVTAGIAHTCALVADGGVYCWGRLLVSGPEVPTPGFVAGAGPAKALSSGGRHVCALQSGGAIRCWGENIAGQLGDGTEVDRSAPVAVRGLPDPAVSVSAGGEHTCAALTSGEAWCWGRNGFGGALGDGLTAPRSEPGRVQGLDAGIVQVALGYEHSCGLTTGGAVKCWGANPYGQLGDGTEDDARLPVDVAPPGDTLRALSAFGQRTCGITSGNVAACWGRAPLGTGDPLHRSVPSPVVGLDAGVQVLATGFGHGCALLEDGRTFCWGTNTQGQVGDGTLEGPRLEPVGIPR